MSTSHYELHHPHCNGSIRENVSFQDIKETKYGKILPDSIIYLIIPMARAEECTECRFFMVESSIADMCQYCESGDTDYYDPTDPPTWADRRLEQFFDKYETATTIPTTTTHQYRETSTALERLLNRPSLTTLERFIRLATSSTN